MLTDGRMNLAHWKRSTLPIISDWETKHGNGLIKGIYTVFTMIWRDLAYHQDLDMTGWEISSSPTYLLHKLNQIQARMAPVCIIPYTRRQT